MIYRFVGGHEEQLTDKEGCADSEATKIKTRAGLGGEQQQLSYDINTMITTRDTPSIRRNSGVVLEYFGWYAALEPWFRSPGQTRNTAAAVRNNKNKNTIMKLT